MQFICQTDLFLCQKRFCTPLDGKYIQECNAIYWYKHKGGLFTTTTGTLIFKYTIFSSKCSIWDMGETLNTFEKFP